MKKIYPLVFILFWLLPFVLFSQIPKRLSYQFVVRDENGMLLSEVDISVRIAILQGGSSGAEVYSEKHYITTGTSGVGNLEIGSGLLSQGSFEHINWSQGPYFLKTETDPNGGSNYTITGVSQMLSVPYALYAENGFYHKIGDLAQGGIIFSLWKSSDGVEHGLVASLWDLGTHVEWGPMYTETQSSNAANGIYNTGPSTPGTLCAEFVYTDPNTGQVYDDWYLPSIWELSELSKNAFIINAVIENNGNDEYQGFPAGLNSSYWSSTELNGTFAWYVQFVSGQTNSAFKDSNYRVRAIRRF